ncbi:multicopper oxidase domain-containing protein [Ditylenchus destructor]|nr:multicopper oxidase domain-containing protein [Ditylenchus destructor]
MFHTPKGIPYYYNDRMDLIAKKCDRENGYSHPLHIHGTHFYVMKIGYAQYHHENGTISGMNPDIPCTNAQQRCVDLHWTNPDWKNGNVEGMQINPSFRDTVNIPTGGYVTLRFRASNPGWWKFRHHQKVFRILAEYMNSLASRPQNMARMELCTIIHINCVS